ncbi:MULTISPECIES: hypothetical protein [Micromonospora]|uniref:Superoxide dismutase n=1 Tax=Micromonospora chalcea TaxID=1874 RepID=A0ABX9XWV6_MICCH|nr:MULTISPECIES: hypothetical protein [Micromonospora]AXO35423.1 superoxide dismutase [Micromonospora sp. B006]EWM65012.1 hypothetical protein MCBG_02145 [Micromonospora sp. M42]MBC8990820.1 superoxide dismutase [Micromonospora chalcea]MBP1781936.1 Fe-Mn family superoxide dismutase [Micromonospora sp. HB375]MCK1809316.1 superoxide dismutase [Micromonospora sp. R42106]
MTGYTPEAAEIVQRAAGVIAAKHRGDLAGAEELMSAFGSEQSRTLGFYLLADLALGLVKAQSRQSMDDLVRELSLLLANTVQSQPA